MNHKGQRSLHQGEKGRKFAHKLETLHTIMSTPKELHAFTGCQTDEFSWMSKHFRKFIRDHKDEMSLFDIGSSKRESNAGNRCNLASKHALLMG